MSEETTTQKSLLSLQKAFEKGRLITSKKTVSFSERLEAKMALERAFERGRELVPNSKDGNDVS